MKRTVLSLFILVFSTCCVATMQGQSRYTEAGATSKFSVGVGVAPGISLPIGTLDTGDEPALGFALRAGLNVTYPLSTELATFLNIGLDMRNPGVKEDTLLDPRFYHVSYLFIQPGLSYSSLGISLNVGIPMSATEPKPRTPGTTVGVDETQEVPTEAIELLLEPRLNGTLTLMDNKDYWLGLDISVGVPLNKLYKEIYQRPVEVDLDGRTLVPGTAPFSAHLGLTFQFGLFDAY